MFAGGDGILLLLGAQRVALQRMPVLDLGNLRFGAAPPPYGHFTS